MVAELLGEVKETIPILFNESEGFIYICEKGLDIKTKHRVQTPFNYVESIKTKKEFPLAKFEVEMVVYNFLGEKFKLNFVISDTHLGILKKACGK
jgi:hypothetical protein